ncbi:MAG: Nif3-like dinuclear metal center hexameric protein [Bacteroides sp.]|nr:Nif3-like dinuclear metal center hexameric protein [Bacteroides sp.]MCM1379888.1 Nif3-like dinuclear metal center hexameric protein [Bacteroides sp.]MCM1446258.1 Nif3-like dinuclear metal center hexameric protein [Prevotella sp.]
MSVKIIDIIEAIQEVAPLSGQEEWDNSGLLIGTADRECSGAMLCLDVTPSVIAQAREAGCNFVISHHPIIFKGVKEINETTLQGQAIIEAIKADITVYCAHTSLDNAPLPWGVSWRLGAKLGVYGLAAMTPSGTGIIGTLDKKISPDAFKTRCLKSLSATGLRCSKGSGENISKVVVGGGACGFLIPDAINLGAQAIVTSDVRYHDFLDYGDKILIVDLSHFDTEKCTKDIFKEIISQKIPNFALVLCAKETNPIEYKL